MTTLEEGQPMTTLEEGQPMTTLEEGQPMTTLEEGQHDQIKNERIRKLLKIKVTQLVTEYQLEDLCPTCHIQQHLVQCLLNNSSALESMITCLEESNKLLVARVIEQRHEIRSHRDEMKIANDVVRAPRGVPLLVGNSLVRDIDMVRTAGGGRRRVNGRFQHRCGQRHERGNGQRVD